MNMNKKRKNVHL